jgi:hypothetical protein
MAYSTPELVQMGSAQNLILNAESTERCQKDNFQTTDSQPLELW